MSNVLSDSKTVLSLRADRKAEINLRQAPVGGGTES